MRTSRDSHQFNCFSPPVMIATLITETVLTVYTLWRYKWSDFTKLTAVTLISLGSFQLAEYHVCTGYGEHAELWSRFGFVMITTLPALGIHIMHKAAGKPIGKLVYGTYALMLGFMVFFLTYHSAFIGHQCTGNYVIFQLGSKIGGLYGLYYYSLLLTGIILGMRWANQFNEQGKKMRKKLESTRALIIGYLVFLVPVALANSIKPQTRRGIPSIMCGFAVLFAFILVFYILPRNALVRNPAVDVTNKVKN